MKRILFSSITALTVCLAGTVQAQQWSFGPKAYVGLNSQRTVGNPTQIGNINVSTNDYGDAVGSGIGAFGRYDRPHWYAQAEVVRGRYSLGNAEVNGAGGGFPLYSRAARTDIRLIAGGKPLPWLRLSAGVVGGQNNWNTYDYDADVRNYDALAQRFPTEVYYQNRADLYRVAGAVQGSFKRRVLEAQAGVGVDIGGLTLDLTYNHGLSPVLDGVQYQQQTYAIQQRYNYWSFDVGYRLFPLKSHLLALRKNRAYERIKRDIPFYRNEVHVAGGLLAEDIGSAFIYENRYTRYLTRRVGLAAGVNMMRVSSDYETGFLPQVSTTFMLTAGIRVLPLYSRRHLIGLTTGPLLQYKTGVSVSSGATRTQNGQLIQTVQFGPSSDQARLSAGWHSSVDYQFAVTDRLLVGPWLRVFGQSFIIPDYASAGIQMGYRF